VTAVPARWGGPTRQEPLLELATTVAAAVVDAVMWEAWLADPDTRSRFEAPGSPRTAEFASTPVPYTPRSATAVGGFRQLGGPARAH
jgi:hypothetical protein